MKNNFLAEENKELFKGKFGDLSTCYPEYQLRWEEEKNDMIEVLSSYGVEVLRPRLLTNYEKK